MIRQGNCPFCGKLVVADDEKRVIDHEAPSCEKFDAMCREAGGERKEGVTHRDGNGREIKVGQA